jgi:hypothetical protein
VENFEEGLLPIQMMTLPYCVLYPSDLLVSVVFWTPYVSASLRTSLHNTAYSRVFVTTHVSCTSNCPSSRIFGVYCIVQYTITSQATPENILPSTPRKGGVISLAMISYDSRQLYHTSPECGCRFTRLTAKVYLASVSSKRARAALTSTNSSMMPLVCLV